MMFLPLKDENPTRSAPVVTVALLVANAAVFVAPWILGISPDRLVTEFGLTPTKVFAEPGVIGSGTWVTLFTSMFLHANWIHLGGNLLYLWIFGNNVEDVLGHGRYLGFYLLAGVTAHGAHLATNAVSPIPTIGASGAIAGILAAYLLRYPHARVVCFLFLFFFIRVIRVPASIVILIWFVTQILGGLQSMGSSAMTGGVAWFEHLGGFAAGLLFFPLLGGLRRSR